MQRKIVTCCYCGTRAALVLRGETRHELSCAACGAPLHNLKALPVDRDAGPRPNRQRPVTPTQVQRRKPKRRKSLRRKVMSEVFDLIEDIFD